MNPFAMPLLAVLMLAGPLAARADQCHYFWATDCFEIRDARSRDITHHVLLSSRAYDAGPAEAGQCPALVSDSLDEAHREEVLKRFNKVLRKLDGCAEATTLNPRVFPDGASATAEWRRLQTERTFKQTHIIKRLPRD